MKILYVTTISNTTNGFLIPHIKMLVNQGHQIDVAFNIKDKVDSDIINMGCNIYDLDFERSPLNKGNYKAYKELKNIIINENYNLVHTHTPVASVIVRLACRNIKDIKVMYTAHGFHFYKGAPVANWLLYYPIEKWLSRYTDCLITINKEDYNRAKKQFKAKKTRYIPGVGLDINKFRNADVNRESKRKEINVPKNSFIVLSVGELNENKNHKVIIKAIKKLNNPDIHYVICGTGPLRNELEDLGGKLSLREQLHLLGNREDISEICKASDVFAFPSRREGLGMASLEAMACGLPIITSNVHGIVDYSIHDKTGYTCNPEDVDGFSMAIDKIYNNKDLAVKFGEYNKNVVEKYDIKSSLLELKNIYNEVMERNQKVK